MGSYLHTENMSRKIYERQRMKKQVNERRGHLEKLQPPFVSRKETFIEHVLLSRRNESKGKEARFRLTDPV